MKLPVKQVNEAAKAHAKLQLGEAQFSTNKNAARAIGDDFKAGVRWAQEELAQG
jgi:hypothetical protein